jgi:hypothetical protein
MIKYDSTNQASINVTPNTSYLIFFVYDNSNHPGTDFKAHLMTPDSALMNKYTVIFYDRTGRCGEGCTIAISNASI